MPKLPTTPTAADHKPYPTSSPKKKPALKQDPDSASSGPPSSPSKGSIKKWSKEDKIEILLKVVSASNPNWEVSRASVTYRLTGADVSIGRTEQEIAKDFGKTKSQVHDQWR